MSLQFYNTLTRKKEPFTSQQQGTVSLYACGPTVYNYAHIGNLRTYIFNDLLRRALEASDYTVNMVMNITDVGHLTDDADDGEDKMEAGAKREGKTAWEIAEFYTQAFTDNATALNIDLPETMPKATDHIEEQVQLIKQLEKNGYTYETSDGIYFDTGKFDSYGAMAQLDIEGLQEGARVEKNQEKKSSTDFALWKFSPTDSQRAMEWDSPWGKGFPGWHLECSAMSMKYLGNTLDIHTGGVDHIPVHHTNEIAQSEAATGEPFVRFWMHADFLLVQEGRMGKSEGNFITLQTVIDKGFDPLAYRYFTLGAHYRSKLNFTWEALENAQHALQKLVSLASEWEETNGAVDEQSKEKFMAAIHDDLNMPQALAVLWEVVKSDSPEGVKRQTVAFMDSILGLSILERADELQQKIAAAGDDVRKLVEQREQARKNKDYSTADALRDQITACGFHVEDTDEGPVLKV